MPVRDSFELDSAQQVRGTYVSNTLIWGYTFVSDQAKQTLLLLLSLDWGSEDRSVWYTREKLSQLRQVPERTVRWHLEELNHFDLIQRISRPGSSNKWRFRPFARVEIERAAFIRRILEGGSDSWPTQDVHQAFEQWAHTYDAELSAEVEKMQAGKWAWDLFRQKRQRTSARRLPPMAGGEAD